MFLNKPFQRFARKEGLRDADLCDAVDRAERGLVDADLGGEVIKQRIARPGQGRSSGFRSIILFRTRERAFFVYGFAKNSQENITAAELIDLRDLATLVLSYDENAIHRAIASQVWRELHCHE